jgi:hypothetical protein
LQQLGSPRRGDWWWPGDKLGKPAKVLRNRSQRELELGTAWPALASTLAAQIAELVRSGLDPSDVAAQVLKAIREDELYVFTHHDARWRGELQARFAAILAAMDKAAARCGTA